MSRATPDLGPSQIPSRIFRAGAGTGKTTKLVKEVVTLAAEFRKKHDHQPRVVVTTFTRKATQELKERLLEQGIAGNDDALLQFVTTPSLLMISTIHGILVHFLTQMSGAIGLDAEFRIVDERQADRKWKSQLRKLMIENASFAEFLDRFSFSQLAEFSRGYVLRMMGGTAPKVLTIHLIWRDVRSLIQEFGSECESCLSSLGDSNLAVGWQAVRASLEKLMLMARDCDSAAAWSQTRSLWAELEEEINLPRGKARKEVSELVCDQIKALKEELAEFAEAEFDPASWEQMCNDAVALDQIGQRLAEVWKKDKLESGELSIEDLEILSLCLLHDHPLVGRQYSEQWDYWFIDEYQDTSPTQVELLRQLVGAKGHFVVGDPQQSIYFFRGARSEVFFRKENEFKKDGVETEFLRMNRRSRPGLLLFFNHLFSSLPTDQFEDMEPNSAARVVSAHDDPNEPTHVARFFILSEREQELAAIVWQLKQWRERKIAYKDMAILTRTHKDLEDVAMRLHAEGFPTQVLSSGGFYDRREILDALLLLRFLSNPLDDVNLLSLIRSPWVQVEDRIITEKLTARGKACVWAQLQVGDLPESIVQLKNYLDRAGQESISSVFQAALEQLGFFAFCYMHDVTGLREANLWKLVQKLKQEERRGGFSFIDFIARARAGLSDGIEQNDGDAVSAFEPNRVLLMTVHASKGLGLPYVIVPFIQKDLRPTYRETFLYDELENQWLTASPNPDGSGWMYPPPARKVVRRIQTLEREENLRLLYVALTRSREEVVLTASGRIGKNSWQNAIRLDLSEGVHRTPDFTYEVHCGLPFGSDELKDEHSDEASHPSLRIPFRELTAVPERPRPVFDSSVALAPSLAEFQKRLIAINRGVRVHKLLEILLRRKSTEVSILGFNEGDHDRILIQDVIKYLLDQKTIPFRKILINGHAEWAYTYRDGVQELRGQIDAWAEVEGEVWILDYKTGRSEFQDKAFEQLAHYGRALRQYGLTQPIKLAAVFVLEQNIIVRDFKK